MKFSLLTTCFLLCTSCAHLHVRTDPLFQRPGYLSGIIHAERLLERSHSLSFDSILPEIQSNSFFKQNSYSECLFKLRKLNGVREITGIPDSTDTISRVIELCLAGFGPCSPVALIKSNDTLLKVYNFGYPVFLISDNSYQNILPFASYYVISVRKFNRHDFLFNPYFKKENKWPSFVVNIERNNIDMKECIINKSQIYVSSGKENFRIIALKYAIRNHWIK